MKKIINTIQDKFNLLVIIMIVYMILSTLVYTTDIALNVSGAEYALNSFLLIPAYLLFFYAPSIYDRLFRIMTFFWKKKNYFTVYIFMIFTAIIIISLFIALCNGARFSLFLLSLNISNFLFLGTIYLLRKKKQADIDHNLSN